MALDKIFQGQGHYGKVKSKSNYDVAQLHPQSNVPTKYELPTPYDFRDIAWKGFLRSRSLQQGQKSNPGQTLRLHNYTPYPMSLLSTLHLIVTDI